MANHEHFDEEEKDEENCLAKSIPAIRISQPLLGFITIKGYYENNRGSNKIV